MKSFSAIDKVLIELEHSLRTCHVKPSIGSRPYPAKNLEHPELSEQESTHVSGLMRVNNAGEVAAQGLYRGQAISARNKDIKNNMLEAANEENEHLNWCQTRLTELDSRTSLLDPFWYWGSFSIGLTAGLIGDKWSLGFVEETEKQVTRHLEKHLNDLPEQDHRSRVILDTMKDDEIKHAINAHKAGAAKLPSPVQQAMNLVSKVMTFSAFSAYRI
ncbi:MAG: 2-polyprenyl-3-methyl-6-methoxy-1,4-benzoquinone monooxygenase [Gammaproteobacteria bacterium]|nr:2-polyprenyl-3-methyl-6-methoxy-1,4-benzoquinone monooxygenase [Gammaproteobacteria bacterium]